MPQALPSEIVNDLLDTLEQANDDKKQRLENPIHVSEITGLPAFAYEKLRNIVDYKEENLLRKNAIRRYLKRKFLLPQFSEADLAHELVRELILSRYLPNDSVDEQVVKQINNILTKYHLLIDDIKQRGCNEAKWREQILGLAAVECDNIVVAPSERLAYTTFANKLIAVSLDFSALGSTAEENNIQLVLAIERVLNKADRDILNFYLLLHYYSAWFKLAEPEAAVAYLAPHVSKLLNQFSKINSDKLGKRLLTIVRRLLVPVVILRSSIHGYVGSKPELFRHPNKLEDLVRKTYQKYWKATRKRIRLKGIHAMAYIFLTKIVLAILIELPYEKIVLGEINYVPLGINLLFPPLLMLIITLLIKSPNIQNEERIVEATKELVYGGEKDFYHQYHLTALQPKFWTKMFYALLYTVTIAGSFSALVLVLWKLNFNILSGALFIFFVSLVSFFGISLRQEARQLKVIKGRETISSFIIDFFAFPVVAFGKWLSTTFDKYNFFVFILDFLFEVPFKTLLKVIEDWFHFLKEKKEEMM